MTFHTRDNLLDAMSRVESPLSIVEPARSAADDAQLAFGRSSAIALRARSGHADSLTAVGRFGDSLAICSELYEAMTSFVSPDKSLVDYINHVHQKALIAAGRFGEAME